MEKVEDIMTWLDKLIAAGLIVGTTMIVVGAAVYDPDVEVYPGRTMPRSQAQKTLAVWDATGRGREAKWINPDPKPSNDRPLFGDR
jgi:hypothetical protein